MQALARDLNPRFGGDRRNQRGGPVLESIRLNKMEITQFAGLILSKIASPRTNRRRPDGGGLYVVAYGCPPAVKTADTPFSHGTLPRIRIAMRISSGVFSPSFRISSDQSYCLMEWLVAVTVG